MAAGSEGAAMDGVSFPSDVAGGDVDAGASASW
jgi:hypothetical protein